MQVFGKDVLAKHEDFGMQSKETKAGPAQWDPQGFKTERRYGRREEKYTLKISFQLSRTIRCPPIPQIGM